MTAIVVRVRYFNVLAEYAGTKRAELLLPPGATVRGLVDHLIAVNPQPFRKAVERGDGLSSYLRVFRNNQLVVNEALDEPIADGDEFMLFPAIAGGCERIRWPG